MPTSVYFSFHYDRDNWRVQQVMQMGALDGQRLLNSQSWEEVKRRGRSAIMKWIDDQMKYKSAVVVLVGSETAGRQWVRYEIEKAWNDKRPLVGVRIHGLADRAGNVDYPGNNPFSQIALRGGGTIGDFISLHNPTGTTSQQVHASISRNLSLWVDGAYRRY